MDEAQSKFMINTVRDVFVFGDGVNATAVKKLVKSYYFLNPRDGAELQTFPGDPFFVIQATDFRDKAQMQGLVSLMSRVTVPHAHKIAYATLAEEVSANELLLAQEVGVRFVAYGPNKTDELKDYLKRVSVEHHQTGSLGGFEADVGMALQKKDMKSMRDLVVKIKALPAESEDTHRLMALAFSALGDMKRFEYHLKQILQLNSQNLWAANQLGRHLLKHGRATEGIEILSKMSRFHALNGERSLVLGEALLKADRTQEALHELNKADQAYQGKDERVKEGLAKVKLAQGDSAGALQLLGHKKFSVEVVAFLNMRAIIAIKAKRIDEGMSYYEQAFQGVGEDKELKAKIRFNMGLAYARNSQIDKAIDCFYESSVLGGSRFDRAKGPLGLLKTIIKREQLKPGEAQPAQAQPLDAVEWETLF